jgi:uncharacterized SAM-binding protein YcdF (DUF218 family)
MKASQRIHREWIEQAELAAIDVAQYRGPLAANNIHQPVAAPPAGNCEQVGNSVESGLSLNILRPLPFTSIATTGLPVKRPKPPQSSPSVRSISCSLIIPVILLAAVLLIRWEATLNYLGDYLVSSHSPQSADLILVLAGDFWGARVLKGADLALQGYAPLALMSGTPYQGSMDGELAIKFLAKQGYPTRLFQSFGHNARSTIEEAIVLRPELARRGVKRVLLVTSAYHSRRAAIVFRLFCPGIRFIAIPAPEIQYHPEGWWKDSNSRRLFFSEWKKILATILIVYPRYRGENIIGS